MLFISLCTWILIILSGGPFGMTNHWNCWGFSYLGQVQKGKTGFRRKCAYISWQTKLLQMTVNLKIIWTPLSLQPWKACLIFLLNGLLKLVTFLGMTAGSASPGAQQSLVHTSENSFPCKSSSGSPSIRALVGHWINLDPSGQDGDTEGGLGGSGCSCLLFTAPGLGIADPSFSEHPPRGWGSRDSYSHHDGEKKKQGIIFLS